MDHSVKVGASPTPLQTPLPLTSRSPRTHRWVPSHSPTVSFAYCAAGWRQPLPTCSPSMPSSARAAAPACRRAGGSARSALSWSKPVNVETWGHVTGPIVMAHALAELRYGIVARQHESSFKSGRNFNHTLFITYKRQKTRTDTPPAPPHRHAVPHRTARRRLRLAARPTPRRTARLTPHHAARRTPRFATRRAFRASPHAHAARRTPRRAAHRTSRHGRRMPHAVPRRTTWSSALWFQVGSQVSSSRCRKVAHGRCSQPRAD
jgi:hypothetical protein